MTREEAIEYFKSAKITGGTAQSGWVGVNWAEAFDMAIKALKDVQGWEKLADDLTHKAPTMDVVEVVRCKDCKHAEAQGHWYNCRFHDIYVSKIDYCSRGIRRPV